MSWLVVTIVFEQISNQKIQVKFDYVEDNNRVKMAT